MWCFTDLKQYLKYELPQRHLINPNCFETSQPAESPRFSKRLFLQQYCMQPFFPFSPGVMKCTFLCYLFLIHSVPPHTPLSGWGKAFGGCQSKPVIRWQSICCCWWGMSNGSTTVLITSPHTCTSACATHLIAPHTPTPASGPDICLCSAFLDRGLMSISAMAA